MNGLNGNSDRRSKFLRWLPLLVLWALIGVELVVLLLLNGGSLIYTLDDPYIHLALAEHLREGHFGLNAGQYSSPASSILWPFMLAPFTALSLIEWIPLLFNLVFASASLMIVRSVLSSALGEKDGAQSQATTCLLTILAIPALNLVGLAFTGMEHSLQVLCAVGLAQGMIELAKTGHSSTKLLVFLCLAPLVRYESTALSAAGLLLMWWNGDHKRALVCGALIGLSLGAYSFFLYGLGLPLLPTSVMAKSASMTSGGFLRGMVSTFYNNFSGTPGVLISFIALALATTGFAAARPQGERRLAIVMAFALGLHLLLGRTGWYNRYEIYAWSAGLLVAVYLWREPFARLLSSQSLLKTAIVGILAICIGSREYVIVLGSNGLASHNIYLQQFQMHRFVTEFLKEPVAVNDLGWVAFQNDDFVLDLWGLDSLEALEARATAEDSSWITPLAEQHGVRTALIYEQWFEGRPESWRRIGELRMAGPRITPADDKVAFYALSPEWEQGLSERLREFEKTLPVGAQFVWGAASED